MTLIKAMIGLWIKNPQYYETLMKDVWFADFLSRAGDFDLETIREVILKIRPAEKHNGREETQ